MGFGMTEKRRFRIIIAVLLAAGAIALLPGCMNVAAEELYSLPQLSEGYLRLQSHINAVLSRGAEFSPPTGGLNRQSVLLRDIDGDGIDEVIAFFSVPGESTLQIYIFRMIDGDYSVAEVIQGVGTAFESIRFVNMSDTAGLLEIVVGWQMGPVLRHMEIFTLRDFHAVSLARVEYSELVVYDLTGNGRDDIIVIRAPTQEHGFIAAVYTLMPDGEIVMTEARLSHGVEVVTNVIAGNLIDGTPAIFVESEGRFEEGNAINMVTDILIYQEGRIENISVISDSGVSEETVRARLYNSADIDRDGAVKIPIPRLLRAQSETAYYAIDWYAYNSDGHSMLALTTYHNNNDEWFLILPFDWRGRVSIRREDDVAGERTVVFSAISDSDEFNDFLKVYKITGDLRENRATLPGRLRLMDEGSAVYAFEFLVPPNSYGLTFDEDLIRNSFRLMYLEWLAGGN